MSNFEDGDFLWRECASWLTRCKIIPPDHNVNSDISLLAKTLRDGVLLCNLLAHLDKNSIDVRDYHKKPQGAQFLCYQNIKLFLDTCKAHYGIKDSDLFEPTMLYDLTNFHRVLITLAKLSQCRKVQQLHPDILGFHLQLSHNERSHSDEAIYKELHTTAAEGSACNGNSMDVDDILSKGEDVYQELCAIGAAPSRHQQITSTSSYEQRDYVIRELVDTEGNYLDVLLALRDKFMSPLEKLLEKESLKIIFPRIRELCDIHAKFSERLHDAINPNTKTKLGQVFLDFREPFLMYGEYCSNLTKATDHLTETCKQNEKVEKLVQKCEVEYNVGKLQLRDILSVPMQRILKYHLLLDKLVKETTPTHEDYRALERAKEAMVDVAQYINEVKRDSDHLLIIEKVEESILDLQLTNGNDLKQYGHLLLDGDLQIKSHEDQKTKHRYAFIFDKILILVKVLNTKTGDSQYTYRESHNLAEYNIEKSHSRRTLGRDARMKYSLLLVRKTQKTAFTLYLKSEADQNKWNKTLTDAMDNLNPPGLRSTDHKFEIITFEQPVICRHCSKFLKGKIFQGYKCKVCEISVHKGCISSTGRCKQNPDAVIPPPVVDRHLSEYNWFVGTMNREHASESLYNRKVGTYLLRVRPQGASSSTETMYALSLKTDDNVKHMKINQKMDKHEVLYFLSSRRHFKNIVDLVCYYERHNLGENFQGLDQSLIWPFREVKARVLFDFQADEANQLSLQKGTYIVVIGNYGDSKGWLRGRHNDNIGYFPRDYVEEHE
ncbi:VAV2 family protein [Megaselia abdita]